MARYKKISSHNRDQKSLFLFLVSSVPLVLISIGDIIRFFFHLLFSLFFISYNIIKITVQETRQGINDWIKEKTPKVKVPMVELPHISLPAITLPTLPTFSLPSLRFPRTAVLYRRRKQQDLWKSFFLGVVVTALLLFVPYTAYQWLASLPNPYLLTHKDLEVTTKIFDRNGILLYEIYADQNRTPLALADIPEHVKQATIAIEDRDFYRHQGFSLRGIVRAIVQTKLHGKLQGGSTITQQLMKSSLLTPEITLSRKQILEMYLNQVPYGGTAWGIEAASQTYFGKSAKNLTLAQAALLAGLPAAPTENSPFGSHPQNTFERQKEVLRRMREDGYITKEEASMALSEKITFASPNIPIRAPHFVLYVKDLLERRYGTRFVDRGGLRIKTSLDVTIQEKAEEILRSHVAQLSYLRVGNGAALITNPKTGEILAMVGSKDYFNIKDEGNVNVTTSLRQPGSAIKVVNYAAALENGFTAASLLDDSPIVYQIPGTTPYAPVNYDSKFHGVTPLRYALGNSYNIPAVKVLAKIGVHAMIEKGRMMGIESWEDESRYGLSLTLGGGEVTMLDMAKVFGTLANDGKRQDLLPVLEITDYTGRVVERNALKPPVFAVKPEAAWILGNILSDNIARTAAFGPSSALVVDGKTVSVKTGTSNDKRDNWTIGYTPSYVVAVWVGNNNNNPMDPYFTSGVTGAAPIWHDITSELLKGKPDEVLVKPDTVTSVPCYYGRIEYFMTGTEPPFGRCGSLPTPSPTPKK
ncbi:transglycosylase domain-containing protein [Candidatus Gottesmanbacteria bacterium]|nr:transglycosylase domain-containing protein [Candidatus Gottesmanbacteria bacterium]